MTGTKSVKPRFFSSAGDFRAWLDQNHAREKEVWVGYYKKNAGKPGITYPQSVEQALCFGWIDGVRHSHGKDRYKIRFTPRKPKSIWSTINIKKASELAGLGLMRPAGAAAFVARTEDRSEIYSFEKKRRQRLDPAYDKKLKTNKKAAAFLSTQIPSYQRTVIHWVMSAKKEETRQKRLEQLIADSEKGVWIPPMRRAQRK